MEAYTVFVSLVLSCWAVLSVAYQFDVPWVRRWSHYDVFSLLPLWTFFAPRPGQSDYHLLYRDRLADGSTAGWQEVEMVEERQPYSWLWNPEKRSKKVLTDVVQLLIDLAAHSQHDRVALILSTPYVLVLNVVMSLPRHAQATHRQFVIAQTFGYVRRGDPEVVIKADFHRFC